MLFPSRVHLIFCLVMRVTYVTGYTNAGSCAPDCKSIPDGTAVWDPRNCRNYYICQEEQPSTVPYSCAINEEFDPATGGCITVPSPCVTPVCIPLCNYELHRGVDFLAHRTDCTKFYEYDGQGLAVERSCIPGHYFNGVDCLSSDPNDCCEPCLVYCDVAGTTVADPLDCTQYYYCEKNNYFPDSPIQCPSGTQYEYLAGECQATINCLQLC